MRRRVCHAVLACALPLRLTVPPRTSLRLSVPPHCTSPIIMGEVSVLSRSGIDNTLAYNTQSHNLLLDQARGEHGMFALLVGLRLPHQSALEESGQTAVTVAPFDAEKTLGIEGLCREDGGKVSHSDGESCCQVKPGRRGAQSVHATGLRQNF